MDILVSGCLSWRNLVKAQAGTRFIMISHSGWDAHRRYERMAITNFAANDTALQTSDQPHSQQDQDSRTLLERPLYVA
jgi:hypothetical protein